ncbi:DgyrCDS14153 [Dimorphilus gyrociliatus]|uniref:protein-tyrosine-phosphatase n=1 Tax=Dimorphilus gyrociliatus TaxID=2664684 RepID=A0A7I8WCX9_9ANNE|nr:DgyrCDS14153 [Dimorphilus gyrociliatus]
MLTLLTFMIFLHLFTTINGDPCGSNPCQNNGRCFTAQSNQDYVCICNPPNYYEGKNCEIELECAKNNCTDRGHCEVVGNVKKCICESGYSGEFCEKKIPIKDACKSNPCKNNAKCINHFSNFECDCKQYSSGVSCETVDDPCSRCENSINCYLNFTLTPHFKCDCNNTYGGSFCDIKLDACVRNPCLNGNCSVVKEGFHCSCFEGFKGKHCEVKKGIKFNSLNEFVMIIAPVLAALLVLIIAGAFIAFLCYRRFYSTGDKSPKKVKSDVFKDSEDQTPDNVEVAVEPSKEVTAKTDTDNKSSEKSLSKSLSKPIKTINLLTHIQDGIKNNAALFADEFKLLPDGKTNEWQISQLPENKPKNRFINVLPYDHSRVTLNNSFNDYINASFINGYKKEREYISSQGPTKVTLNDFWSMIWDHKICKIVMVANEIENGREKCACYWPDSNFKLFGDMSIMLHQEERNAVSIFRIFHVTKGHESRAVRQFHYVAWPDHGVPVSGEGLLQISMAVNSWLPTDTAPVLVHCSAGIGRSGTFIAIDSLLKQANMENKVDVLKFVTEMRKNRVNMVQTLDQYIFIYKTLLEALCYKESKVSFEIDEFLEIAPKIIPKNLKKLKSSLLYQYNVLNALKPVYTEEDYGVATAEENTIKNNNPNILPVTSYRATLTTAAASFGSYINAVLIPQTCIDTLYIATQMPNKYTEKDLWRLVYDYNASHIIMLNSIEENEEGYWPPLNYAVTHPPFSIKCLGVQDKSSFISRHVLIESSNDSSDSITTHHLELLDVRNDKEPFLLVRIFAKVKEFITKDGLNDELGPRPIIVHCTNGADITGLYIAFCMVCDIIENEKRVDVFSIIKKIRLSRPEFITAVGSLIIKLYLISLLILLTFNLQSSQTLTNLSGTNKEE